MLLKSTTIKTHLLSMAGIAVILLVNAGAQVHGAEIRCGCAEAIRPILADLGPEFEQATGHKLVITYGLAPVVMKRIQTGSVEAFKRTLLNSKAVAFPDEGTSGAYFRQMIRRLPRKLIAFLSTPAAMAVMKGKGWEPIP